MIGFFKKEKDRVKSGKYTFKTYNDEKEKKPLSQSIKEGWQQTKPHLKEGFRVATSSVGSALKQGITTLKGTPQDRELARKQLAGRSGFSHIAYGSQAPPTKYTTPTLPFDIDKINRVENKIIAKRKAKIIYKKIGKHYKKVIIRPKSNTNVPINSSAQRDAETLKRLMRS